jgi:xylulokinase
VVPDTWYVMGVMLTAGGAFAWHRDHLAPELHRRKNASELLNQEASKVPIGSDGLTFLPYMQGERTPHRDAAARGAFVGLTLAHTRAHMSRAVLEGICFGLRDSVSIMQALELPLDSLLLTGGGARSAQVRRMQADVYGLSVTTVNREEGPPFGAALLAGVGAGVWDDVPAACAATLKRRKPLAPNAKAHAAYDVAYKRYRALYPALRPFFSEGAAL